MTGTWTEDLLRPPLPHTGDFTRRRYCVLEDIEHRPVLRLYDASECYVWLNEGEVARLGHLRDELLLDQAPGEPSG